MSRVRAYALGTIGFLTCAVGGPALMVYIRPSDEELFQRFSPEIQKRNLENRDRREKEFNDYVTKLKEYSKSDKPIWYIQAEEEKKRRREYAEAQQTRLLEESKMRDELQGLSGKRS